MLPFCVCVLLFSFQSTQITHKFACSICGRVYASQRSIKAHIEDHEDLSLPPDKDDMSFLVVETEVETRRKQHIVKFHENVLYFFALNHEQGNDLHPSQIAEETATGRSRGNTPRGTTSTKGRSAAILAGPSQSSLLPSPTEWQLPQSVWEDQPPLGDNFGLLSNINEAITTSQGGYILDPSNDVEQTTLSKPVHLERKESFDPINCYDGSYPSYPSFNNENFFKSIYPHQHNEEQMTLLTRYIYHMMASSTVGLGSSHSYLRYAQTQRSFNDKDNLKSGPLFVLCGL